jgi:alpha-L-arabinofuranosidase
MNGEIVAGQNGSLYASAVRDEVSRNYIVKVVNLASEAQEITLKFDGLKRKETLDGTVTCTTLHSENPYAENTIEAPQTVVPVESALNTSLWHKNSFTTTIGPRTFVVYSVQY